MKTIKYRIYSQLTGLPTTVDAFEEAKVLRQTIMNDEINERKWWPIQIEITNEDGSITLCDIDESGQPVDPSVLLSIDPSTLS